MMLDETKASIEEMTSSTIKFHTVTWEQETKDMNLDQDANRKISPNKMKMSPNRKKPDHTSADDSEGKTNETSKKKYVAAAAGAVVAGVASATLS